MAGPLAFACPPSGTLPALARAQLTAVSVRLRGRALDWPLLVGGMMRLLATITTSCRQQQQQRRRACRA